MRLAGKTALVTGAATGVDGQLIGFGGATARLFAREGAMVVVPDIDVKNGEKTASQIRDAGAQAIFVRLDVTSEQDWIDAIRHVVSEFGGLDILVNNAGTVHRDRVEETTVEVWEGQMQVHAREVFLGTKHAIPEMRRAGGGSIVNVSSIFGIVGSRAATAYSAAKGAVRAFTKTAAVQYAGKGIRVKSVHPGFVMTPLTKATFTDPDQLVPRLAGVPMGRLGTVDEIVYGILYLASDEASFVTGAELVINGGMTAQ